MLLYRRISQLYRRISAILNDPTVWVLSVVLLVNLALYYDSSAYALAALAYASIASSLLGKK